MPDDIERKLHCEALWEQFHPYADSNFVDSFAAAVLERYWEMYVGCVLLGLGLQLVPMSDRKSQGPDILINLDGKSLWIECICPKPGEGPDQLHQPKSSGWVPTDKILLRLSSALDTKRKVFDRYLKHGWILESDYTFIAIGGEQLGWRVDSDPSYAVRSTYGIGDETVTFSREEPDNVKRGHSRRPAIDKSNGVGISMTPFQDETFENISGAIFDMAGLWNPRPKLGETFKTVHNSNARNKLDADVFTCGTEYVVKGECLVPRWHR